MVPMKIVTMLEGLTKPGTAVVSGTNDILTSERERVIKTSGSMRATKDKYHLRFTSESNNRQQSPPTHDHSKLNNGHAWRTISSAHEEQTVQQKKDQIDRLTNYYRSKSFMDPSQFDVVSRERLTSPNFELACLLRDTLSEVRKRPEGARMELNESNE